MDVLSLPVNFETAAARITAPPDVSVDLAPCRTQRGTFASQQDDGTFLRGREFLETEFHCGRHGQHVASV